MGQANLARVEQGVSLFSLPYCHLDSTGLTLDEDLTLDQWLRVGRALGSAQRSMQWWIGDYLRFGERKYGEMYAQAEEYFGFDNQTLRNMVWVANEFPASRRRDNLSWSHHKEVAAKPLAEQERLLDLAQKEGLSRLKLRGVIKAADIAQSEYASLDVPLKQDFAAINAAFVEARKTMDDFCRQYSQFRAAWDWFVGGVRKDLDDPATSSVDWVYRKIESGCWKLDEIIEETSLSETVVQSALKKLLDDGFIYTDKQGAATEQQRGARETLYIPVTKE